MRARLVHRVLAAAALALLVAAPGTLLAFDRRGGDVVRIPAGEVITDDLMVAAETFVLDGRVEGDVLAVGQTITINGTVAGDLIALGGAVTINGTVTDDVRIGGTVLTLGPAARIGDDVLAGGSSFEAAPGAAVQGALIMGGSQALVAGSVGEELIFGGEGLELRGRVERDVEAYVGGQGGQVWAAQMQTQGVPRPPTVPSGLTIQPGAAIGGDLRYTSRDAAGIPAGAVAGEVAFTQRAPDAPAAQAEPAGWWLDALRRYAALLFVGIMLLWLAPKFSRGVAGELEAHPLGSLGWGAVSIFAIPFAFLLIVSATVIIAVALGAVQLGGLAGITIAVGIVALMALVVLAIFAIVYVAQVVVSFELGKIIVARLQPSWNERPIIPLALGLLLLVALGAIPQVGWIIGLAAAMLGLGALWLLGRDAAQRRPAPAPIAV